jgi:hypothetical protein
VPAALSNRLRAIVTGINAPITGALKTQTITNPQGLPNGIPQRGGNSSRQISTGTDPEVRYRAPAIEGVCR